MLGLREGLIVGPSDGLFDGLMLGSIEGSLDSNWRVVPEGALLGAAEGMFEPFAAPLATDDPFAHAPFAAEGPL